MCNQSSEKRTKKGGNGMVEKLIFDYSKLEGLIKEKFGTHENLVKKLSYGRTSLSSKLNNKTLFSQPDILELQEVLGIPDEELKLYFFKLKVRKNELAETG